MQDDGLFFRKRKTMLLQMKNGSNKMEGIIRESGSIFRILLCVDNKSGRKY